MSDGPSSPEQPTPAKAVEGPQTSGGRPLMESPKPLPGPGPIGNPRSVLPLSFKDQLPDLGLGKTPSSDPTPEGK